ncbi:MAG: DUF4388 domain-containing protein [Chitinivibrionales bacterium]|nr:DUF4388 domain-containing protein [Chitinivibrionales bacterium]
MHGNLSDFDISYIIQMITQENKTGSLMLKSKHFEGMIVFKKGKIICAETSDENIETILFKYLQYYKKFSEKELYELYSLCKKKLKPFTAQLIQKKYAQQIELTRILSAGIEDITCSCFILKQGTYSFTAYENVSDHEFLGISYQFDAIAMEAARRSDEWERIITVITNDTIFYKTDSSKAVPGHQGSDFPLDNPASYLMDLVDGVSSTDFIVEKSFLSKYRVYETLFHLQQSNQIAPVRSSASDQNKRLKPRTLLPEKETTITLSALSISISAIMITIIYIFSTLINQETTLHRSSTDHPDSRLVHFEKIQQKIEFGSIYYQMYETAVDSMIDEYLLESSITERERELFLKITEKKR